MAKRTADVELRIRKSKGSNATKDVKELDAALESLVATQAKQANAAELAATSLRELNAQQNELAKLSSELARRKSLIESLIGTRGELAAAKSKLNGIRAELAGLLREKTQGTFLGDIDKAINNVKRELASADKEFNRTAARVEKLDKALVEVGVNTQDLDGALVGVTASMDRAQIATANQAYDIERLGDVSRTAATQLQKVTDAQKLQNAEMERASKYQRSSMVAGAAGVAGVEAWQRQRKEIEANAVATERVRGINERFADVLSRNEKNQRAFTEQTNRANTALDRNNTNLRRGRDSLDQYGDEATRAARAQGLFADTGRKSLSFYQRLRGQLLATATAYVGLYEAVSLLGKAITTDQKRAAINAQLSTVNNGDARRVAEDQRFLRAEAERLGIVYDELAGRFANFAISAKAAGVATGAMRTAFTQATEVVVGARLSAEDADGVFRAFVQIMSKARVQAEELRGQLGDRLPGAVAKFAEANNIALKDLDKFLKKGEGNVQTFLKFLESYAESVQGAVETGSRTVLADINRLKTAYNDFLVQVAQSGTADELQKAVQELTAALKGKQGAEFAKDLAFAFSQVLNGLRLVVENFDTFVFLVKALLALQAVKAVVGLGAAFGSLWKGISNSYKSLTGFYKAAVAARTATAALTVSQRGLLLIMGPVGIAIAAASTVLYGLARAADKADERMNVFLDTLGDVESAQTVFDLDVAVEEASAQLDTVSTELKRLQRLESSLGGKQSGAAHLADAWEAVTDNIYTAEVLSVRISEEQAKQAGLQNTINAATAKRVRLLAKEAEEDKARAEADKAAAEAANAPATVDGDAAAKSAEAAAKRELAAANARANAGRAVQKELLNLDQEVFDARLNGEVRTAEQIAENYDLTIRDIESKLAEKALELEQLAQNSATANGGTISAEDLEGLKLAQEKLDLLQVALNMRALEAATLQEIALGETKVNELIALRDAKLAAVQTERELGLLSEVEARRKALDIQKESSAQIVLAIDELVLLLESLPPDLSARLGIPKMVVDLKAARLEASTLKSEFLQIAENLAGDLATGAAAFLTDLGVGLGKAITGAESLGDSFSAALDSFRNFVAQFLIGIAQTILQATILQAIMNAIRGTSGGYGDAIFAALGVKNHDGGIVGQDGKASWFPASAWSNAKKYHDGGLPGLKSNEVATVLEKGEEVLTENNPRHVKNAGKGGGGAPNLTVINAIDSEELAGVTLNAKAAGPLLMNWVMQNGPAIRKRLGV